MRGYLMGVPTLSELGAAAVRATEPAHTSRYTPRPGGVDPLGLRQINFDLMDQVLPGINNVARHIRPFAAVTWAWRRAAECARESGKTRIAVSDLQDFVDRIEVLFVWSQFLRDPNADLPGRDVLAPILTSGSYVFGGKEWRLRKEKRQYSTALSAPINYGPALKSLRWITPHPDGTGAMIPNLSVETAVAAFESELAPYLGQPAFGKFGEVTVTEKQILEWSKPWALDRPTRAERQAMLNSFIAEQSPLREGAELIREVVAHLQSSDDVLAVRRAMCGTPTSFRPSANLESTVLAWRLLQNRQLFRLALEAMFHWSLQQLDGGSKTTKNLVSRFLKESGAATSTSRWLMNLDDDLNPADRIEGLRLALSQQPGRGQLPAVIRKSISAALSEAPSSPGLERHDRLPLARARREALTYSAKPPDEFLLHVFESWIFGQHVYWAVGRGLADARAQDKMILRLKVIYEENGWTLAPGVSASNTNNPAATPDRLGTALSLLREAGAIKS